jgi:hypothetical protein
MSASAVVSGGSGVWDTLKKGVVLRLGLTDCFKIIFARLRHMRLSQTYKKTLLSLVQETFPTQRRGRPRVLDPQDALDSLFQLIRTGMQWRELVPRPPPTPPCSSTRTDGQRLVSFNRRTPAVCRPTPPLIPRGGTNSTPPSSRTSTGGAPSRSWPSAWPPAA